MLKVHRSFVDQRPNSPSSRGEKAKKPLQGKSRVEIEAANGFANRFLFACVRRSKKLPQGGQLPGRAVERLAGRVRAALEVARRIDIVTRSPKAEALWAEM